MSRKSVLIVDADGPIRLMLRAVLLREGFDVDDVSGLDDAIARLQQRRYDVAILDVLVDGAGHDVLELLATRHQEVKCVVISASSPAKIEKIALSNVSAKLRKPFDIDDLLDAVRKCGGDVRPVDLSASDEEPADETTDA